MYWPCARLLPACCLSLFFWTAATTAATTTAADFVEPRGALTLSDAISAALQRNPALRSAVFDLRAADARIAQAGLRPNPELGIALENFGGSGEIRNTRALESTLMLSQAIELGGQRGRRVEAARYERDAAALERDARQLDVLAEVTRRFIDVAADQEQLLLTRRGTRLLEKTFAAIERRVAAARAPEAEKSRAAIALGRARLEEKRAEQELLAAHRQLAALWGSTEPRFGDAQANLFELPPVTNFEGLLARLKTNPDFLRFATEQRLRDAQWRLAKAEAKSSLSVGAGVRRFEATGDTGLVVDFSMPLPFANRNQGAIREADIRRDRVQLDEQAAFVNAQATLFELYQSLQQARARVAGLREQLTPLAETALAQTQYGYERGRFSYLELADAQRELLELQREAIEAAATYHRVFADIERLTREPLAQSAN